MEIIGICGKKRSGKDEVADALSRYGSFCKRPLANVLKEIAKIIFLWNDRHVYGDLKEVVDNSWGVSPRQVLQFIGTECFQHRMCEMFPRFKEVTGRCLWIDRMISKIKTDTYSHFVIPDIRFFHEEDRLREEFGEDFKLIRVTRPILDSIDEHESEAYYNDLHADAEIINDGTLEDLHENAINVLEILRKQNG
jgi:hypothetical protein